MVVPLHKFDELRSTQETCRELIQGGAALPLGVFAKTQSDGRGRQGKAWESPEGNLYLTLAIEDASLSITDSTLVPLKVGLILQQWLEQCLQVRASLKWPNDLLHSGYKLAGILCETSLRGERVGAVIIGIGLNVYQAPGQVEAIALEDVTSAPLPDCETLAQDLADRLVDTWDQLAIDDVCERYTARAQLACNLWSTPEGLYRGGALEADGSLVLKSTQSAPDKRLSSSFHDCRWAYSAGLETPLAIVDIGNSATKVAVYRRWQDAEPDELSSCVRAAEVKDCLASLRRRYPGLPMYVASVNQERSETLRAMAAQEKIAVLPIQKRWVQGSGDYDLSALGVDRLAAIESYLARRSAHPAILVLLGTATTYDVVDDQGKHWGGWILPGMHTSLLSLSAETDLLPELDVAAVDRQVPLGSNTKESMQKGTTFAIIAQIEWLRQYVQQRQLKHADQVEVIMTGGFSPLLAQDDAPYEIDPYLIVDGLKSIVSGGALAPRKGHRSR